MDGIEKFCDDNKMYQFEGERGIKNLNKILAHIDYKGHGFAYGSPVEVFLADNPGAIEAIIEFIGEYYADKFESPEEEDEEENDENEEDNDS